MSINWLVLAPTQFGFSVPTYEKYGGPRYSAGLLLGPGQTPNFSVQPGDALDALFREHDQVYFSSTDPNVLAQADLTLIMAILALPDTVLSDEAHLYAGAATLGLIVNIAVTHGRPDLLTPDQIALFTADAVDNLQKGSVQPDPSEVIALISWFDQVVSRINEFGALNALLPSLTLAGFLNPVGSAGNDILLGGVGEDTVVGLAGDDFVHGGAGNDLVFGGPGFDILAGGTGQDRLFGQDDNDVLVGGDDDDHLDGGNGRDGLFGQDSNDRLLGRDGNDTLDGGTGTDLLLGQSGDDVLLGRDGNDRLDGGVGRDRLLGQNGDDVLIGREGTDRLDGGTGHDVLLGLNESDLLIGRSGRDYLDGGAGNDSLLGGDGIDRLLGRDGSDRLDGGFGSDVLFGGNGNDVFVCTANLGNDVVLDFGDSIGDQDILLLRGLFSTNAQVLAASTQVRSNVVIRIDGDDSITLRNFSLADFGADDFRI